MIDIGVGVGVAQYNSGGGQLVNAACIATVLYGCKAAVE